ncbi:hypothetical protein RN001_005740 [Aquatica leii]|uniref:Uncharacterized protein n=1 Tax=Aquatica leii TaxID=1421715 RepID=A0AAN7SAS1_9COLE|nr:hypothetical protein RN001_005740 [Aquatica leii]
MKPVKIVSTTGKKQVSQAASAERGESVTFVGIISASGQSLPPKDGEEHNKNSEFIKEKNEGLTGNNKIILLSDITILQNTPSCSGYKNDIKHPTKVTPELVRPFPKAIRKETKTKRTPGTSRVYTDTPEKERLEQIENEKEKKEGL